MAIRRILVILEHALQRAFVFDRKAVIGKDNAVIPEVDPDMFPVFIFVAY
jgi:hypothetical protein